MYMYHVLYMNTKYYGLVLLCFLVNNTEFWTREKGSIPKLQESMNLYTFAPRWQRALILLVPFSHIQLSHFNQDITKLTIAIMCSSGMQGTLLYLEMCMIIV